MSEVAAFEKGVPDDAACLECGYALKGLTQRACPECSAGFDPRDSATFTVVGLKGRATSRAERGPGWVVSSGCLVAVLMLLYGSSVPGGYFDWWVLGSLVAFIFGVVWLIRQLVALAAAGTHRRLRQNARRFAWRWATPVVIAVVGVSLLELEAPLRARWMLAAPRMQALAQQVQQTGQPVTPAAPAYAGGMELDRVEPFGTSGTVFFVRGSGFIYPEGFAYLPDPADKALAATLGRGDGMDFRPYAGDWYLVLGWW
ncbi:hypothetical protein OT109_08765 [Phycisphaeraceae bacterium D3-23]